MDGKEKYETLSSSSKNFERDTYKLFRLVLKSRIFSFPSILPCRGEAENYILGTLGLRKMTLYFYHLDFNIFSGCLSLALALRLHCKSPTQSPSRGENP